LKGVILAPSKCEQSQSVMLLSLDQLPGGAALGETMTPSCGQEDEE